MGIYCNMMEDCSLTHLSFKWTDSVKYRNNSTPCWERKTVLCQTGCWTLSSLLLLFYLLEVELCVPSKTTVGGCLNHFLYLYLYLGIWRWRHFHCSLPARGRLHLGCMYLATCCFEVKCEVWLTNFEEERGNELRNYIKFLDSLFKRSLNETSFAIQPVISKAKYSDEDFCFESIR